MTLLKSETPLLIPYNLKNDETCTWFEFTTDNDIRYEVTFIRNPALFCDYPSFAQFIYEMSILQADGDSPPFDFRVQLTIADIVRHFFENNKHVLLFVCDSLDERQEQRRIKFSRWYEESGNKSGLEKYDGCISAPDMEIFSSIILREDFELKVQVLEAFFEIND